MELTRRGFLASLTGITVSKLSIGNLPREILDVLNIPDFPIDITGISQEGFITQMKKVPGVSEEIVKQFLEEREEIAKSCSAIGRKILGELGISQESTTHKIRVHKRTPPLNPNNPERILNRWGYTDMSWDDFFKSELRHTIEGSYELEDGVTLFCKEQGVTAQGNISLKFTPNGIIKLILHIDKKTGSMLSQSTQGIEIELRTANDIKAQIFDWKTRDWSQEISAKHKEVEIRLKETLKKLNKKEKKKRTEKNINILKGTSAIIPPDRTLELRKETKSILIDASKKVCEIYCNSAN